MNAQTVVQLLILLDQITAQVIKLVESVKDLGENDEKALQALIAQHRASNDAMYESIAARLKAKI